MPPGFDYILDISQVFSFPDKQASLPRSSAPIFIDNHQVPGCLGVSVSSSSSSSSVNWNLPPLFRPRDIDAHHEVDDYGDSLHDRTFEGDQEASNSLRLQRY